MLLGHSKPNLEVSKKIRMRSSNVLVEATPNNPLYSLLRIPSDFVLKCFWVCVRACLVCVIRVSVAVHETLAPFLTLFWKRFFGCLNYYRPRFASFVDFFNMKLAPVAVRLSHYIKLIFVETVFKTVHSSFILLRQRSSSSFSSFRCYVSFVLHKPFSLIVRAKNKSARCVQKIILQLACIGQNENAKRLKTIFLNFFLLLSKFRKSCALYFSSLYRRRKRVNKSLKARLFRVFASMLDLPCLLTISRWTRKLVYALKCFLDSRLRYLHTHVSSGCHASWTHFLHSKQSLSFFIEQNRLKLSVVVERSVLYVISLAHSFFNLLLLRCQETQRNFLTRAKQLTQNFCNSSICRSSIWIMIKIKQLFFSFCRSELCKSFVALTKISFLNVSNATKRYAFSPFYTTSNSVWKAYENFVWTTIPAAYLRFGLFIRAKLRKGVSHNNFTLHITQGQLVQTPKKSVIVMENMTVYQVKIENENNFCCNATLSIDGKVAGCWRLRPFSSYTLDRPVCEAKKFVFVQENSKLDFGKIDATTKIETGSKHNGEIEVKFVPCFIKPLEVLKPHKRSANDLLSAPCTGARGDLDVRFDLWDTAGQERYNGLGRMYYRGADVVVLAFDLTNKKTFEAAKNRWFAEAKEHSKDEAQVYVFAGLKSDLVSERQVTEQEGKELAMSLGFLYFETSSKFGTNVDAMFHAIGELAAKVLTRDQAKLCLKVIVIGDWSVGKTALIYYFMHQTFASFQNSTIGASFATRTVRLPDVPLSAVRAMPQRVFLDDDVRTQAASAGCVSGGSGGDSGGRRARELNARTNSLHKLASQLGFAMGTDEQEDETATGGTTLAGHSGQEFKTLSDELVEDPSKATTIKIILMLSAQHRHQKKLASILLEHKYPLTVANVIAEYLYAHSVLNAC